MKRALLVAGAGLLISACGSPNATSFSPSSEPSASAAAPTASAIAPPARQFPAMAYDALHKYVLLFGGWGSGMTDTWTWDSHGWAEQHPAHTPPATQNEVMAYDPAGRQVLLVTGPIVPTAGIQTWTWDGTDWQLHRTAHVPSAGSYQSLVLAPSQTNLVLVWSNGPSWAWTGDDWVQSPIPSPPSSGDVVYDEALGAVVFAGTGGGLNAPLIYKLVPDTTSASAARSSAPIYIWQRVEPGSSAAPNYPIGQAHYAEALNVLVYFKYAGVSGVGDWETWTWDGAQWRRWPTSGGPAGFWYSSAAYDPMVDGLVFFGGGSTGNLNNQTWVLSTDGWRQVG